MEIKDILNNIKEFKNNIEKDEQIVNEAKHTLELANNTLKTDKEVLQYNIDELDRAIRDGDKNIPLDAREIEGCEIKTVQSRPAVIVEDANALPERFIINKPQVDKKAIKEALEGGEEINGASMREVTQELRVEVK